MNFNQLFRQYKAKVMEVNVNAFTGNATQQGYTQEFLVRHAELVTIGALPSKEELLQRKEQARLESIKRRYSKVTGFDPAKLKVLVIGSYYTVSFKAQELGIPRGEGRLVGTVVMGVHGGLSDTFTEKQLANRE